MGSDKAFARFGDATLIEWMLDRLAPAFPHAFIVANDPARFRSFGLPVVTDALAEGGRRSASTRPCWRRPSNGCSAWPATCPSSPLGSFAAWRSGAPASTCTCPGTAPSWQPLCAVYARSTLPAFETSLRRRAQAHRPDLSGADGPGTWRWGAGPSATLSCSSPTSTPRGAGGGAVHASPPVTSPGDRRRPALLTPEDPPLHGAHTGAGGLVRGQEELGQDHRADRRGQGAGPRGDTGWAR